MLYTNEALDVMGKGELRAAMRAAGLPSKGLNEEVMRAHLEGTEAATTEAPPAGEPAGEPQGLQASEPSEEERLAAEFAGPLVLAGGKAAKPAKAPREAQPQVNGVTRPKAGNGPCATIWSYCDRVWQGEGTEGEPMGVRPELKELKAAHPELDTTTAAVQYYRWRKYHGISGR